MYNIHYKLIIKNLQIKWLVMLLNLILIYIKKFLVLKLINIIYKIKHQIYIYQYIKNHWNMPVNTEMIHNLNNY